MIKENQGLQAIVEKIITTSDRASNLLIPRLQKELRTLEAQVVVLVSQTRTEIPWELMSERVTAEIDRVLSIRSASSPAQSSDMTRVLQEEVQQLDAKTTLSLKSLSRDLECLWGGSSFARECLVFLNVFPLFPRSFRDSAGRKLVYFGWFSLGAKDMTG